MAWYPISPWKLGAVQKLSIGAAPTQATAFNGQTKALLLVATADCHVRTGGNPTAVATDTLIKAAHPPIVIGIGVGDLISVIQDSTTGSLYVTELSH